jgi:2-hydroxy-3-keto-5-methylthiopentenyl-1-phosphate phosphatase
MSTIPPADAAHICIDFDGTISKADVLDDLLKEYAIDDSWKAVEDQWQQGLIGSKECLERQLAVVRISDAELERFLDRIAFDDGIFPLLRLANRLAVPVTVLSDGIDLFIHHLLKRFGIGELKVRANTIWRAGECMELVCPFNRADCESAAAHCKCFSMKVVVADRRTIYIGDGRSDLCPSRKADCVMAKGNLARMLTAEEVAFSPYSTLSEVAAILSTAWNVDAETPGR